MFSDPYNPEKSPEALRTGENVNGNQGWDELASEYKEENPEASPEEWADKMGEMPEFDERAEVYEKVTTAPSYGVDAEGEEFNRLMTDYLAKGFWLRSKGYASEGITSTEIDAQLDDMVKGQQTEGGKMKYETMSEAGASGETAVGIFELSKRADFGVDELGGVVKGVPELSNDVAQILAATDEIRHSTSSGATASELKQKYMNCLSAVQNVEANLARADVSVQLSGAILAKTKALEKTLRSALDSLTESEKEAATEPSTKENAPEPNAEEFAPEPDAAEFAPEPGDFTSSPEAAPAEPNSAPAEPNSAPNFLTSAPAPVSAREAVKESEQKIDQLAELEEDLRQAV